MKSNKERAADLFAKNTEKNEVHFTSDNYPFFNKNLAETHAKSLEDKAVETITREQAGEAANASDGNNDVKPFNKMNVAELKAEVAKREGLTVADNATKAQMVDAIQAFDKEAAKEGTGDNTPA